MNLHATKKVVLLAQFLYKKNLKSFGPQNFYIWVFYVSTVYMLSIYHKIYQSEVAVLNWIRVSIFAVVLYQRLV